MMLRFVTLYNQNNQQFSVCSALFTDKVYQYSIAPEQSIKSINYLVVFFDVIQTTIVRDESCDLLAVLNKLNSDTFSDSRVRLLGLNTNLFQYNTCKL